MISPITYAIILITCIISIITFSNSSVKKEFYRHIKSYMKKGMVTNYTCFYSCRLLHLFFNMYVLYMFGPYLELYFEYNASLGFISYMLFYILSAILQQFQHYKNGNNPNYLSLGASGAVSAVVFAYIVLNPLRELGILLLPGFGFSFIFESYTYWQKITCKKNIQILHMMHISGALFGVFFILFLT